MIKLFALLLLLALPIFTLPGCGGGGGGDTAPSQALQDLQGSTSPTAPTGTLAGPPANLVLATTAPPGTFLSQGGQATISATVTDSSGNAVVDGTTVNFIASGGTITASSTTRQGLATATFQAGKSGGIVTITCTVDALSKNTTLQVASGPAATITLASVAPEKIGVKGSGTPEVSTITFQVLDDGGNPVNDGTPVNFKLAVPLSGGEKLDPATGLTASGKVSTTLISGTVAGIASVNASVTVNGVAIFSEARVTIMAGKPDSNHLGLAAEKIYLKGYDTFGLQSVVTAYLADRYSNPVPMNTPVHFATEGGIMSLQGTSGTPTNFTNGFGQATATWITAQPTPDTVSAVTGTIGINSLLAFTEGHEAFVDINGNGVWDAGEPFDDLGEPFIDANDNGVWDGAVSVTGEERFIDANGNGLYDGPNGQRDQNVLIWVAMKTVFSDGPPIISIFPNLPGGFSVPNGGSFDFTVVIMDQNGNSMPEGSKLTVAVDKGRLLGKESFTYPIVDPLNPLTEFTYRIADDDPLDTDPLANATITITLTSPIGDETVRIFGTVD